MTLPTFNLELAFPASNLLWARVNEQRNLIPNRGNEHLKEFIAGLAVSGVMIGVVKLNLWYRRYRKQNPFTIERNDYNTW
jgi:hypothetical protein